jgi:hypothetical protein
LSVPSFRRFAVLVGQPGDRSPEAGITESAHGGPS